MSQGGKYDEIHAKKHPPMTLKQNAKQKLDFVKVEISSTNKLLIRKAEK